MKALILVLLISITSVAFGYENYAEPIEHEDKFYIEVNGYYCDTDTSVCNEFYTKGGDTVISCICVKPKFKKKPEEECSELLSYSNGIVRENCGDWMFIEEWKIRPKLPEKLPVLCIERPRTDTDELWCSGEIVYREGVEYCQECGDDNRVKINEIIDYLRSQE